ncbi:hypothetical protein [Methylovulum psychrotolerans]|uniref:Carboxypeptidase regulatory-like domain-containing protein n=1 Tax=Methylovulum psychrotolerans TaxID=1704499 RepID=A0A1Z4BVD1_9GAMM|nr:hypothetical protein [Methylovulum psychrotolerans]ASF45264.1 hypothetical protein CEK71_03840 [Methylovulum psychrotolerans]
MTIATFPLRPSRRRCIALALCCWAALALTACEKNSPPKVGIHQAVKTFPSATVLKGLVSTKSGPIKAGEVTLSDAQHQLIAKAAITDGHYQLEVAAATPLPVILSSSAGGEALIAAIVDPSVSQYDLNPLTTAIAHKAQALGGYTRANMVVAAETMINAPDANKTSTGFRGDPTTQYGGWH